jgi:hypothetical protein
MVNDDEIPRDIAKQIERYKHELQTLGMVLRGTITERMMPCGKPGCRCQAGPSEHHGPYYQWTTKVDGRTKTVRIRPEDVPFYERWIAAGRRLDELAAAWKDRCATAAPLIRGKSST